MSQKKNQAMSIQTYMYVNSNLVAIVLKVEEVK